MKRFSKWRREIVGALFLALALMGFAACSSKLVEQIPPLEEKITQARTQGAQWCAPKEFAAAEANLDFAKQEMNRKAFADAKSYLNTSNTFVATALENSVNCRSDLDGDGVPDISDGDPYRAEDFDGWQDADGIPDPDNDGDGFLDSEDACPDSPEDFDGFQDNDGCPDIDNDGDGIPDGVDKCPNEPEDFDGFEDEDGCPDPDNDHDGICDPWVMEQHLEEKYASVCHGSDKCPNAPETFNGFLDDDGCPDIRPMTFKIIVPPEVKFIGRSAKMAPASKKALRDFAGELMANPELSVRIEAHVEPTAKPDADHLITQKQADAIFDLLVGEGIAPSRLIAIGFGGERPLEDAKGAANRRVMMIIYQSPQSNETAPAAEPKTESAPEPQGEEKPSSENPPQLPPESALEIPPKTEAPPAVPSEIMPVSAPDQF